MTLDTAKYYLVRERMDWKRPHLRWVPNALYTLIVRTRNAD